MPATSTKVKLKVFFDTNIIFNTTAHHLLKKEVYDLINGHSNLPDVEIEWHIPEMVIEERRFQMIKQAKVFLPTIAKMEQLLDSSMNITEATLINSVAARIDSIINKLRVNNVKLDDSKVDWKNIVSSSVGRIPPFEDVEKNEKGFRDAVIFEIFKQAVKSVPASKKTCSIILICNDGMLKKVANDLAKSRTNILVLSDVNEFISHIGVLNSEITQNILQLVKEKAPQMFFFKEDNPSKNKALFYQWNIIEEIEKAHEDKLDVKDEDDMEKVSGNWTIHKTTYVKKEKKTIYLKNAIKISVKTYKNVKKIVPKAEGNNLAAMTAIGGLASGIFNAFNNKGLGTNNPYLGSGLLGNASLGTTTSVEKTLVNQEDVVFEVFWHVNLNGTDQLVKPIFQSIEYISTDPI